MTNNILQKDNFKKLRRSRSDKMLAGVCGGWAKMLGVDAALLRIIFTVGTIFSFGTGVLVYLACWILMPEED
ncbi:phage shock protein C (PspC) family protein [Tamaricihabitans halophyticus]|uniref:Phage shock protein C (PspC) family protein n=1 Tax=Tamaricihabitans halophyticus TaxID=1262583 RepID=A0A4R2R3I3_9PSEU|nr:PspC domain-containing protein [Tamaricihabitans halophyticus]TCP56587.1 phage shock protein C (PspC) family protein [Tamaricihabitans halophyticus]